MYKFWMMGGAVIAVSVAAMVWNTGPVRSSENLLGKAQSEFATKARDALIQRHMAQASAATAAAATAEPSSTPSLPLIVASLQPAGPQTATLRETRSLTIHPEPEAASVDAAIAMPDSALPSAAPAASAEETKTENMKLASLPDAPQASVSPNPEAAVVPVAEIAKADTPTVTSTLATPQRRVKKAHNTRSTHKQPGTTAIAYRSERTEPRNSMPYNLQALRAHAPQIAAAIARYNMALKR